MTSESNYTIAVAGKGGTGKTTLSSLVIGHFLRAGKKPVFAVDADANYNLNEQLGVKVDATIGGMREEMKRKINANEVPPGMSKDEYLGLLLHETIVEAEGFDLLVMGRPEGPGCYCAANNMLRRYLEVLAKNYPVVVIDNEAGMEHLSRRTTQAIDLLLLVSEPSPVGVMSAARIRDLAVELEIGIERTGIVINRVPDGVADRLLEEARGYGLDVLGTVPADEAVAEYALRHLPAVRLPPETPAVRAIDGILGNLSL